MSNNKKSSIDWYFEQIRKEKYEEDIDWYGLLEKAKAMHKEESIEYAQDFVKQMLENKRFVTAKIIYEETFGEE